MSKQPDKLYYVVIDSYRIIDGQMCKGAAETAAIEYKRDNPGDEVEIVEVVATTEFADPQIKWVKQ